MKYYLQDKPLAVLIQQEVKPSLDEEVTLLQHTYVSIEQARNMSLVANHETGAVSWVRTDYLYAVPPVVLQAVIAKNNFI